MAEKKELEIPKTAEVTSTASGDQNQITGLQVAGGRAGWAMFGEKDCGYVFKQNNGFKLKIDEMEFDKLGLTMDALLDCMAQLEEMGTAAELKKKYSFRKNQGFVHPGLVIVSKIDPRVKMAVALHDPDYEKTDVLLGWFVDVERLDQDMKFVNPKLQPERSVDPEELKAVEHAREALAKESIELSPEEKLLGLTESFKNNSIEMFRSNKERYLGGKMDAKRLNEMKEAGVNILDASAADANKPGIHLTNPTISQLDEASTKALEEGFDKIFVHRSAVVVKREALVEHDLFEGVDGWGEPLMEAEVGTAYGEKTAGAPTYSKDVKKFDKEVDGKDGIKDKKDEKMMHMDPSGQIEKPHSEVGKEYDEKDADKKNQLGDPKDGMGDHVQGKGSSSSQETGVVGNKVKVGAVDSKPKVMGEEEGTMKEPEEKPKEKEPEMDETASKKARMEAWKKKRMEDMKMKRMKKEDDEKISDKPELGAGAMDGSPKEPEEKKPEEKPKMKEADAMLRRKLPEWAKKKR